MLANSNVPTLLIKSTCIDSQDDNSIPIGDLAERCQAWSIQFIIHDFLSFIAFKSPFFLFISNYLL